MSIDLEKEVKVLKRKLKLFEQALSQNSSISKKYTQTLNLLKQKEHFTSIVIESNKNAIIAINENRIVTIFNKSAEEMFGYTKEEMINKDSLIKIIPDYLIQKHLLSAKKFLAEKSSSKFLNSHIEQEGKHKDGTIFPVRIGFGVEKEGDNIIVVANLEDISFEKKAQNSLKELNNSLEKKVSSRTSELENQYRYLQSIIDGINDPVMVISDDYTVTLMNTPVTKQLKKKKLSNAKEPKCYEIYHNYNSPCNTDQHSCPLKEVMQEKTTSTVIHAHSHIDGKTYYAELSASPLFDAQQNCIGIIESSRDITSHLKVQDELREQKDILHHQAYHDELTGLSNRIFFNESLDKSIARTKRNNSKFALFFIDLDRFKQINDSLGHDIGDIVLKSVAKRLKSKLRSYDILARLGGDEFTILMEDLHNTNDAIILAKKIIKVLEKPIIIDKYTLYISLSIGISLFPEDANNAPDLLKYADAAMYKAKDEGRNNFQFYSAEMTKLAFEKVSMETELRQALNKEEFVVYYQAQVDGVSNKLVGMEALVRWKHPKLGMIPPDKFIPLAEETGLIVQLDRWVMKTAMTQIAHWYKEGLNPGVLALNLAVKQLQQDDFVEVLKEMCITTGVKLNCIELEVTENGIMNHPEAAIKTLQAISDFGIELAIDDFGTGYSSLSHLKKLPINKLKIDQSFVKDLPFNEEDIGITNAVIALSKSLNLRVIAEGVETQEQRDFLVENGCKDIQGYFYSKPISAQDMDSILKEGFKSS